MTADEMFEKLGYKKVCYADTISYENGYYGIDFNVDYNCVCKYGKDYIAELITPEELKAINQKVKELGWIE